MGYIKTGTIMKETCKRGHTRNAANIYLRNLDGSLGGSNCRLCTKENANKMAWKNAGIKNSDGSQFTKENYNRLFQIQGGRCAMKHCQIHQSELKRSLDVDHDHLTGFARGLLCATCNKRLGMVEDRSFMESARLYLNSEVI